MKQKGMVYALIVSVAAVWGIIFYRVYFAVSTEDPQILQNTIAKKKEGDLNDYILKDTFTLALNYRDPFSSTDKTAGDIVSQPVAIRAQLKHENQPAPFINWGQIRYSGYIINPVSKKVVSIMAINNRERMMAEGEALDGFKLLKNFKDSVKIEYQGKTKFIALK